VTTSQHSPPSNYNDVNRILWISKNQTNKNPERHAIIQNNTDNNYVFSNDLDMEPVIKEIAYSQQKRYMPDVGYIMNVENVICLCIMAPKH
jgi:hypothetical protein